MGCLYGEESIYSWKNKLVPLEVWVRREGRREEAGWGPWTSERRWSRWGGGWERKEAGASWVQMSSLSRQTEPLRLNPYPQSQELLLHQQNQLGTSHLLSESQFPHLPNEANAVSSMDQCEN